MTTRHSSAFSYKYIHDPLYGPVGISKLESKVIETATFQRLHNVKQLGFVPLVFPGASYSRFEHSVGACHMAGQMLDAIERNSGRRLEKDEVIRHRLAALLHDVGHYPFSHATEEAIHEHYSGHHGKSFSNHEAVGRILVDKARDLRSALGPELRAAVKKLSSGVATSPIDLTFLLSSDVDCDRLDYLERSADIIGMSYGKVEAKYIASQFTLDEDRKLCLSHKAIRAADHMLISRFYDYAQIIRHKTVMGLEEAYKRALRIVFDRLGADMFSTQWVEDEISHDRWWRIDDIYVRELLRAPLMKGELSPHEEVIFRSILQRRPPKLIYEYEMLWDDGRTAYKAVAQLVKAMAERVFGSESSGNRLWYFWMKEIPLIKEEKDKSLVRVLPKKGAGKAVKLIDTPGPLLSVLRGRSSRTVRIYKHLEPGEDLACRRRDFEAEVGSLFS